MKRLWLAGGILAAIFALCLFFLIYQQRQVDALLADLDDITAAFDGGDTERALALSHSLEGEFDRRTRHLPCFMAHGDLIECRESLALLPSILKDGDAEEFYMESTRCRRILERITTSELPTMQNIL